MKNESNIDSQRSGLRAIASLRNGRILEHTEVAKQEHDVLFGANQAGDRVDRGRGQQREQRQVEHEDRSAGAAGVVTPNFG